MGFEIDFLPVGEESSGGDAIVVRYGDLHGPRDGHVIVVIDGGYLTCGEAVVQHIRTRYDTNYVDIVLSTHPDQDHTSGLKVVVEEMDVGQLWMHLPWQHSTELNKLRASAFKSEHLSERLEASLQTASDLETIANRKGIPIVEPFTGLQTTDGAFVVLGPTPEFYESLLEEMSKGQSLFQRAMTAVAELAKKAREMVEETLHVEILHDDVQTSPRNNTSAITLLTIDSHHCLLTGDAGIPALKVACDELNRRRISSGELRFVQVPHHGSKRNVGPTILDRLLGPKGQETTHSTAFISAPKKNPDEKHPAKRVANAFRRRGYAVHATQGTTKWHYHEAPARPDFSPCEPLPFYNYVEADDTG